MCLQATKPNHILIEKAMRLVQQLIFGFLLTGLPALNYAQINEYLQVPDTRIMQTITRGGYIQFNPSQVKSMESLFEEWGTSLGINSPYAVRQTRTSVDWLGHRHVHYRQYYTDIPIYGTYYRLHFIDGMLWGNGNLLNPDLIQPEAVLQEEEALVRALDQIRAKRYYWEDPRRENRLKSRRNNTEASYYPKSELMFLPVNDAKEIRLCHTFQIYCVQGGASGRYFIDAETGVLVKFLPAELMCETGTFTSNFNGAQIVSTYDNGDEYELEDDCFASVYGVYDETNNLDIFTDADNDWEGNWKRSAATSLWSLNQAYSAYFGTFGLAGHDGDDGNIDIYQAHYFENGGNNNASFVYDPIGDDEINIGIGNAAGEVRDDYNTLDIVGHEYTHGVDEYSAELEYEGESGALDESFADIFGEWIEFETTGVLDWFIGGHRTNANGCPTPIRYFINPGAQNVSTATNCTSNFNDPNTYAGTNWVTVNGCDPAPGNDFCGVHTNSGVQNQMFYLLVNGGAGWNNGNTSHANPGDGYPWAVTGIGLSNAILIGYYAHVNLLGPTSNYSDARDAWVAAANFLFGPCSFNAIQTGKAWHAVGLPPPSLSAELLCNEVFGTFPATVEHATGIETLPGCTVSILNTGNPVAFKAGTHVHLRPGFHAQYGSSFESLLTDCEYALY